MTTNSEDNNQSEAPAKKLSFAEAMRQKLASNKDSQQGGKNSNSYGKVNTLKSQQTKKQNNQRRRTGV